MTFVKILRLNRSIIRRFTSSSKHKDPLGMSRIELETLIQAAGFEKYRGMQVYENLNLRKPLTNWNESRGLPISLVNWLNAELPLAQSEIISHQISDLDETQKFLVRTLPQGKEVEMVIIPSKGRLTLCLSSQVGCSLKCTFCHTGTQKFEANLTAGDIIRQYLVIPFHLSPHITNIVFMGQGEPLYNFDNVARAVQRLTDTKLGGLAKNQVTISTSGITPLIPKIATELGVNLAVSLHSANDELRSFLMPVNKTYPLSELREACLQFIKQAPCRTRRISFEYVLLKGINDGEEEAAKLAIWLKPLSSAVHVNLMNFNYWPGAPYQPTSLEVLESFKSILERNRIPTTVRISRGQDILAACGQLKSSLLQKHT